MQHRYVMARVSRAREALEADDAISDDPDVLLGHWHELAPETVERVTVEPAGTGLESRGVDQVRRSDCRDMDLEGRELAHERARGAGVVEVDVRKEEMPDLAELVPALGQAGTQSGDRRRRPAVEEGEAVVGLDEVAPDVAATSPGGGGRSATRTPVSCRAVRRPEPVPG